MKKIISLLCVVSMFSAFLPAVVSAENETTYVLSGNALTDADKAIYAEEGKTLTVLDTNASYAWTTDSLLDTVEVRDAKRVADNYGFGQQLLGGTVTGTAGQQVVFTKFNSPSYVTAQFDLKGVYSINGIDVWELVQTRLAGTAINYKKLGEIEVYAGQDRNNMALVWSGMAADTTEKATGTTTSEKTSITFTAPVDARFIDIKLKKRDNLVFNEMQYRVESAIISEILILGSAQGEGEVIAKTAEAKAQDYINKKAYYTDDSIEVLIDKVADMKEGLADEYTDVEFVQELVSPVYEAIDGLVPAFTHYTLSGNPWTANASYHTATVAAYENWGETFPETLIGNTPVITWNQGSSSVSVDIDITGASYSNMHHVNGYALEGSLWSKTSGNYPVTSIFDLGAVYAIDRVDVVQAIGVNGTLNKGMGQIGVYVSNDGLKWKKIDFVEPSRENPTEGARNNTLTVVQFPVEEARYVAVETLKGTSYNQYILSEEAVFGYKALSISSEISEAEKFVAEKDYYTAESIEVLEEKIAEAKAISAGNSLEEIEAAKTALKSAINSLVSVNTRKYVSSNAQVTGNNLTKYQEFDANIELIPAGNTATYEWLSDESCQGDITSGKYNLKDGDITNINTYATTAWNEGNDAVVKYDLGGVYAIDRVDVFNVVGYNSWAKDVTVSLSTDGAAWTDVKTEETDGVWSETATVDFTRVNFAPQKARYVKVTMTENLTEVNARLIATEEIFIFAIDPDFEELEAEIAKYGDDELSYIQSLTTEESYNAFNIKLQEAKEFIEAGAKLQTEVDEVYNALKASFDNIVYINTEGILTCNLVNNADKTLYKGYDNLYTGLSYEITVDDGDMKQYDWDLINDVPKTPRPLTSGFIMSAQGKYDDGTNIGHLWGAGQGKPSVVTIVVNAGKEVYFTGLDLYEYISNSTQGVGTVAVFVSDDNEAYEDVITLKTNNTYDKNAIYKIGADFIPVKGQYLKLVCSERQSQQILAELVIKGFVPGTEGTLEFGITEYTIMDNENGVLDTFAGAKRIIATGTIISNNSAEISGKVYSAVYDGERMVAVVTATLDSETGEWFADLTLDKALGENAVVKNYLWSDDFIPLALAQ